jgi:hypothetical protein
MISSHVNEITNVLSMDSSARHKFISKFVESSMFYVLTNMFLCMYLLSL